MKHLTVLILTNLILLNTALFAQLKTEPICIGEKITIKSEILDQEREILIKLPENYENADLRFPVHYVLDGEIIFYSYSSIVEIKSSNEEMPEVITVGITNINRGQDLNPKANGVKFLEFISKELIPFIDDKYRTNKHRLLSGYSMAGNYVVYAFFNEHEYFDSFLSGSPYRLDLYNQNYIDSLYKNIKTEKRLYTSFGNKDRSDQLEFFNVFCQQLDEKNKDFVDFKYEITENRDHNNNYLINWQDGLDYIYKDWKIEK